MSCQPRSWLVKGQHFKSIFNFLPIKIEVDRTKCWTYVEKLKYQRSTWSLYWWCYSDVNRVRTSIFSYGSFILYLKNAIYTLYLNLLTLQYSIIYGNVVRAKVIPYIERVFNEKNSTSNALDFFYFANDNAYQSKNTILFIRWITS